MAGVRVRNRRRIFGARRIMVVNARYDDQTRRAKQDAANADGSRLSEDELLAIMARCRAMTPPGPRTLAEDLVREDRDGR